MPPDHSPENRSSRRNAVVAAAALACLAFLLPFLVTGSSGRGITPGKGSSPAGEEKQPRRQGGAAWMRIRYDDLVDRGTVTHSERSVGARLDEIAARGGKSRKKDLSDLQPYLEPFSFVCNDIVSAATPSEQTPYISIVADYPQGSRQPAWAALFRAGLYQLFVGEGKARLFLKGEDPARLFEREKGVIRHPLERALEASGAERMVLEVYAFRNDYASRTIRLDLNPYVVNLSPGRLRTGKKEPDLDALAGFFEREVTLEAAGIEDGNLVLYGTPSPRRTLAGAPQSLQDFAVVYRSVFHNGGNPPYISLDRNEDNRYAKVNFGGFLEDTRVGSVVLEADKLFKTMCTGLDPNTRRSIRETIRGAVPDFATSAERSIRDREDGYLQIRYWFYPDRIRTVTDGSIGAVENHRFLADAERLDRKVSLGRADRETIDHLNRNFDRYAQALPTYRELDTVGRMMAVVNWLRRSGAAGRADLDALLSVELPPFSTPRTTRKLVAVTAEVEPGEGRGKKTEARRKTYSLDNILDSLSRSTGDREILDLATKRFYATPDPDLVEHRIPGERAAMDAEIRRIESISARLQFLRSEIERGRGSGNGYAGYGLERYSALLEEYRTLKGVHDNAVDSYHKSAGGKGLPTPRIRTFTSVGGGINLRPKDFPAPLKTGDSPILMRIREGKDTVRSSPGGKGGILRTMTPRTGETKAAKPPSGPWKPEGAETGGKVRRKKWSNGGQGSMTVERNPDSGVTRYRVETKGYSSETTVNPERKEVGISNPAYPKGIVATGNFSRGGTIVLRKGKTSDAGKPPGNVE